MPDFEYVLRTTEGHLIQGRAQADSAAELGQQLRQRNQQLLSCQKVATPASPLAWRRPARFNLLLFCRELQILLQAGLPLMEALQVLNDRQSDAGSYREQLLPLLQNLQEGQGFSQALAAQPAAFPRLFVALIAASEQSGAVEEALARYIAYQESWQAIRSKLLSAAIYPAILLSVGSLVCAFMLFYLAPKFSLIYRQSSDSERWSTQWMMTWGQAVQEHQWLLAGIALALLALAISTLRQSTYRQRLWHFLQSRGPLKRLAHVIYCTQFYRALALLLRGGNTVLESMQLARQILPPSYHPALQQAGLVIQQGGALSGAFVQHGLTTDIAGRMLHSGERSGQLAHMLEQIARFHEQEIMARIDRLTRLLEPLLMLFMGLLVGGLVIAMYLPIFDMAGQL